MKSAIRLFRKELKLNIYPALYLFLLLNIFLVVPSYPYTVVLVFSFIPIQIYMQSCLANNELGFTAMLPISRRDMVMSKHLAVYYLQILHLVVSIPFAFISACLVNVDGNIVGTNANSALYGIVMLALACMNLFMMSGFFRTGCKIGIPYVGGLVILGVVFLVCELLIAMVPALKSTLDSTDPNMIGYQMILLAIGLIVYVSSFFISIRLSEKNFEKVNI